ncbi:MAG: ABC transporter substrate-binding protein [Chlorobi bacterium]|nr:ABC transporter substrate-binding protein [Chlorobiota bacterium]
MNLRLLTTAAAIAVFTLAGCSKTDSGDKPAGEAATIKIGQIASMTGKEATFGQQVDDGIKLAIEEINKAGGLLGKKVELITEDTQSQTPPTKTAMEKLVSKDQVVAVIGEVASSRSMAAAPIAERGKVTLLSPASTNSNVTLDKDGKTLNYVYRICFIDPFQGTVMAKFASENLKAKNIAVLKDNANDYSVGLAKNFTETFTKNGGTIVEEQAYEGGQTDFKAQLTAIKAKNPEAIFVPGYYTEVSLIAQQARELGIKAPLLGGDGWDSPVLTQGAAKQALEGSFFSNHYSEQDTSAVVLEFIKRYTAKYNEVPGAMSALGYDAMNIIAKVIKDAGKADAETIAKGLATLKDYPGVTGKITIDAQHNANKPAVVLQIKDGKYSYYSTIAP